MVTIFRVLHNVLFIAGYLSTIVLAAVISHYGREEVGLAIFAIATAMYLLLLVVSVAINRRDKPTVGFARETRVVAANAPAKIHSLHASASYEHDPYAVWSLIRPAESAVLLSDAQRAFTVPGTPSGVGEQQCFINRDGSVSIVEVIGEESPWWATTRPIAQNEINQRFTYRLEPTPNGCTLTIGAVLELPGNATFAADPNDWWESHSRTYLIRIQEVLSAR
ncbi:hypothetical protein [Arthrobacter sp. B6]|uniref:hypothetical protein n=1 Tax=Arthrobacter sp. B6 TaxID=1570137 RepID=UPI00082E3ACF|nr:hypothetical protein [Arthrobacter sp. B6]